MNLRQEFFAFLENKKIEKTLFFPDISNWYMNTRIQMGEERPFWPGEYIPDSIDFNKRKSSLAGAMAPWTFLDYYRKHKWGLPAHMYHWCTTTYKGGVKKNITTEGGTRTTVFSTPKGDLQKVAKMSNDGSFGTIEHFVKDIAGLEIVKYIAENTIETPNFTCVETFLKETGGFGVCDIVINRSPFGKLVHELMGFENVVYALFDNRQEILDFLKFQEQFDLDVIEKASNSPARLVIISDHADENLISPAYYRDYCIPYYQKACRILHKKGKFVSTHLDGNFKGYFPLLKETGFDLLDGCTPAPMFNYEVEELAEACAATGIKTCCGVPSTLFVQKRPAKEIEDFGRRIARSFKNQVIAIVGDLLPPDGDIHQVIELGKALGYK